ncbi:MAG TPA: MBL fold metallo-hydrolase [Nocardioidaceae bacterium]|nr:MBL fold metallo-hydrolase [Nocardioidaceae bacterium]
MQITTVADGVHFVETPLVSWVVLEEGERVALIDAGYPGQVGDVEESVRRVGRRPEEIEAVLVTHGHVDHVGGLPHLAERYGVRILTSEVEGRNVRGEVHESATPLDVARRCYNPRVALWGLRAAAAGGTRRPHVDTVEALTFDVPLDLPRSPVAVSLAGHTSGHTAYLVPGAGAIALGDALVTAHGTTARRGPQLLPGFFHHDDSRLRASLKELAAVDADRLLPGHGPTLQLPVSEAVSLALA